METSKNTNLQNPKLTKPFHNNFLQESLSLRDLPLNTEDKSESTTTTPEDNNNDTTTELFEFLTSTSYDVSPAENIIFAGKLIPLNHQNAFFSPPEHMSPRVHGRSESLSAIQGSKLHSPVASDNNAGLMRTSRSLNYRKITRGTTTPPENNPPAKSTAKLETTSSSVSGKTLKPRWYVIMFGMVKFPPEIELKDIKNRQIRRNIPTLDRKTRRSRSPPSWKFLNALSCKDPTSVAATAPFWTPHA